MDRVHIPYSDKIVAGAYYVSSDGDLWHRCPLCKTASAMVNHSVTPSGEVNASIACFPPCSYHVWGILDGWRYGEKKAGERVKFTEETCPGHVASDDPKVCVHCGTHIDSMRPPDDDLSTEPQ